MKNSEKILKLPIRISLAVILFGIISKLLEWSFAKEILLAGFSCLTVFYAFRYFKKDEKKFIDTTKFVLVLSWSINGILQVLDLPFTLFSQALTAVTFVIWFVLEGTAYFMDDDRNSKNSRTQIIWNGILIIGSLVVITGGIMQFLEWDYSIHLLSLGITLIGAYVLKDVFLPEEHQDNNKEEYQV